MLRVREERSLKGAGVWVGAGVWNCGKDMGLSARTHRNSCKHIICRKHSRLHLPVRQTLYYHPNQGHANAPREIFPHARGKETLVPCVHGTTWPRPFHCQTNHSTVTAAGVAFRTPLTHVDIPWHPARTLVCFIGRTSGTGLWRRDHQTSWARSGGCRRRAGCGRTGRGPA